MNESRMFGACTVFEGKIVISGGIVNNGYESLKSVEAYDHVADEWSRLPSMIEARFFHSSVAVRNKLFVIGGFDSKRCEVYDSGSNRFTALNATPKFANTHVKSVLIGGKIIVFSEGAETISCYDTEKDEWTEKHFALILFYIRLYCISYIINWFDSL